MRAKMNGKWKLNMAIREEKAMQEALKVSRTIALQYGKVGRYRY